MLTQIQSLFLTIIIMIIIGLKKEEHLQKKISQFERICIADKNESEKAHFTKILDMELKSAIHRIHIN